MSGNASNHAGGTSETDRPLEAWLEFAITASQAGSLSALKDGFLQAVGLAFPKSRPRFEPEPLAADARPQAGDDEIRLNLPHLPEILVVQRYGETDSQDLIRIISGMTLHFSQAAKHLTLQRTAEALRARAELRAKRIDHVQRVGSRLKLDLDVHAIASQVVDAAREALGFKGAVLNLIDRPGEADARARVVATCGIPSEGVAALTANDYPVQDIETLFRPEFLLSRSYFIPAGALDSSNLEITQWVNDQHPSVAAENAWQREDELLVPLMDSDGGQLLGFLSVDEPETGLRPEAEDVEILEIFADQAVTAFRCAALLAEARRLAHEDPLTGLLNHRSAHELLDDEFARARTSQTGLGIVLLDLDGFKLINDSHGHHAGDLALRHMAALLSSCLRSGDGAARLGGDEFLLVLRNATRAETAAVAERLLVTVRNSPFSLHGVGLLPVRLSLGIAAYPDDATHPQSLLALADRNLYEAKRSGQAMEPELPSLDRRMRDTPGFDVLNALVHTVETKDRYTLEHSEQVVTFACMLAESLDLSPDTQRTLRTAGLLHDVGKVGVPDEVLQKPGPLSDDEWRLMREHVVLSTQLVQSLISDPDVVSAVAHHHERWDGRGYPSGIRGEDIPLVGRIMIMADAVSAMLIDRPYRAGLSGAAVIQELRKNAGSQFDPSMVEPFITAFRREARGSRAA